MPTLEWILLILICMLAAALATFVLRRQTLTFSFSDGDLDIGAGAAAIPERATPANDAIDAIFTDAPIAIWTANEDDELDWSNDAYRSLSMWRGEDGPLFPAPLPGEDRSKPQRYALYSNATDGPEWYEVTRVERAGRCVCYAQNVSALVNIEESKRTFFQTMAGTFAHLSIGLAIFDEDRRLNLFNPALVDLCGLPFSFLSSRPDLASFFDRLRESQSLPEPRDYTAWRTEMSDLAKAAAEGRYQETWTLPSGSVYQVTGRPHPGGAIAFLFEDISAEVGLARQFRSELALYRSALDMTEDATCILSAADKLMFANAGYLQLWSQVSDDDLRGLSLSELCSGWSNVTGRPFDPDEVRRGAMITFTGHKTDDQILVSTVLPGGDLLIRFRKSEQAKTAAHKAFESV